MAQFLGYLLKSGTNTDNSFIQKDTFESTPNQREEIKAVRDENTRNLVRITADGMKTAIKFTTMPVNLAGKVAIQNFFNAGIVDSKQRRVRLTYWNDEDNVYKTSDFYLPDITFTISTISEDDIQYNPLSIELIEY